MSTAERKQTSGVYLYVQGQFCKSGIKPLRALSPSLTLKCVYCNTLSVPLRTNTHKLHLCFSALGEQLLVDCARALSARSEIKIHTNLLSAQSQCVKTHTQAVLWNKLINWHASIKDHRLYTHLCEMQMFLNR